MLFYTKGSSLEQIDVLYRNTTPMMSVSYRRQLERDGLELSVGSHGGTCVRRDPEDEKVQVPPLNGIANTPPSLLRRLKHLCRLEVSRCTVIDPCAPESYVRKELDRL